MPSHTRKLILLMVLLGLWAALFALRQGSSPATQTAPARPPTGAERTAGGKAEGLPRLKTELLDRPMPAYTPEVQNIFGEPPPPPRPPAAAGTGAAPGAPQAPPAPPPDPFVEGAKAFRYVGFLRRGGTMIAFIIQGQQVYTLPVGETLDGRYRVQAITEDSVVLSSPGGDRQVNLALTPEGAASPPPR